MQAESRSRSRSRAVAVAQAAGFRFILEVAVPPREKRIEVEGLREALLAHLQDDPPHEVDLGASTSIDDIADIELDGIAVSPGRVQVEGAGALEVTVRGGGSSDGVDFEHSFPFTFEAELHDNLDVVTLEAKVDASSWTD